MRPIRAEHACCGVRGGLQRIVLRRPFPFFHPGNLGADGDHGVDEAVELGQRLAFGRLDHQRARHREAHGRCVKTVVHQALGDIFVADARGILQRTQVENAFVRHAAVVAGVEHRIVVLELFGDVVGRQNGHAAGLRQAVRAHHAHIHPRNRQHAGIAQGGGADRTDRAFTLQTGGTMHWQERGEVGAHADRPHAGAAAAVRNAESLMQIQVRHIRTELGRTGQADQRVHIGAVHIHLPAILVDDVANGAHFGLEHAVRTRVGDHARGELVGMLLGLGAQIGQVDVALRVAGGDDHPHARHLRRRRVGAVGRRGNQADIAMPFTPAGVIGANDQQP